MRNDIFTSIVLVLLAAFIGGGVPPFSKIALKQITPFTFIFLRFILAGLVLGPLFLSKEKKLNLKKIKLAVLISLLATSNVTFFALGVRKTTATISQMLYAAVPIIVAITSYFILKTKMSLKKILGVIIGFIGVLLIVLLPVLGKSFVFSGDLLGNLLVFIAVFSYSLYSVFSKKLQKYFSPLALTTIFIATTLIVQSFLALSETEGNLGLLKNVSFASWASLVYVGILGTAGYYIVYQLAIKKANPIIVSMVFYLQPVSAFIWSALMLGERLTLGFIAGSILAFIGATMVINIKK